MGRTNQQQKILILAAIPHGLRLDKEIRKIEDAIRRANKRDSFDIRTRTSVRPQDIRHAIAEEKPQIVHFCGHGLEDGSLLLEDEGGHNKSVSPSGLASLFQLHVNYVNCVVLDACYSAKTAEAISQYINYAIGMNQPVGDKAAIVFAQGFYDGLGYSIPDNQDVFERGFSEGKIAIELEISNSDNSNEHLIPVLLKNPKPVSIISDFGNQLEILPRPNDTVAKTKVNFENDIFISYAHIDNQPLTEGQVGWISDFHKFLEIRLTQLRGEKVRILRDFKLQGNDSFNDEIVAKFPTIALLVSVLSPRYVKSTYCIQELQEFCKCVNEARVIRVTGNKSRIFKVIKTPVLPEQQPQELQTLLGYEFYEIDLEGRPHEFNKIFGSNWERKYWAKLEDLAYDISQLLENIGQKQLDQVNPSIIKSVKPTGTTIYLAETTSDLNEGRDKVKRELQQRGHIVLPDQLLPYNPNFSEVVGENLEHCKLSIHLVGKHYGIIPEGLEQSMVELQYSLALEHKQRNSDFSYLVWIPNELKASEPRQFEFIQCLQDEPELLQTTLEDLKTIIQDKLNPCQQSSEPKIIEDEATHTQVYLICDQRDLENIEPVEEYLWSQEWEVIPSIFEGNEAEVRQYHQESLSDCDAVLIYYGEGNELWLRTQLRELQKATGYGRSKPMLAKAVYVAEPATQQKQRFRTRQATVIKNFEEFSPNTLEQFRVKLTHYQGGLQ